MVSASIVLHHSTPVHVDILDKETPSDDGVLVKFGSPHGVTLIGERAAVELALVAALDRLRAVRG